LTVVASDARSVLPGLRFDGEELISETIATTTPTTASNASPAPRRRRFAGLLGVVLANSLIVCPPRDGPQQF
jgi:hypothetical protein